MCVQGTKSKHAFIILTLICSQKRPSVENCETACLKDLRPPIFLLLIQRSWLCCNWIFKCKILQIPVSSVSFPWKNPNQPTSQKTHYGASCRHMKSFGLLSLAQITQASLVLKEISPLPTQPNFWVLSFSLFPIISTFTIFPSSVLLTAALHPTNRIQLWRECNPGRRQCTQSLTGHWT